MSTPSQSTPQVPLVIPPPVIPPVSLADVINDRIRKQEHRKTLCMNFIENGWRFAHEELELKTPLNPAVLKCSINFHPLALFDSIFPMRFWDKLEVMN
jgi:hypothetical protein